MRLLLVISIAVILVLLVGCAREYESADQPAIVNEEISSGQTAQQPSGKFDIAAINITISSPSFEAGDRVTVYPVIKNLGEEIKDVRVALYANDALVKTFIFDFRKDETKSPQYAWYPEDAGKYEVRIVVDPDRMVDETSRQNNEASTIVEIY